MPNFLRHTNFTDWPKIKLKKLFGGLEVYMYVSEGFCENCFCKMFQSAKIWCYIVYVTCEEQREPATINSWGSPFMYTYIDRHASVRVQYLDDWVPHHRVMLVIWYLSGIVGPTIHPLWYHTTEGEGSSAPSAWSRPAHLLQQSSVGASITGRLLQRERERERERRGRRREREREGGEESYI